MKTKIVLEQNSSGPITVWQQQLGPDSWYLHIEKDLDTVFSYQVMDANTCFLSFRDKNNSYWDIELEFSDSQWEVCRISNIDDTTGTINFLIIKTTLLQESELVYKRKQNDKT